VTFYPQVISVETGSANSRRTVDKMGAKARRVFIIMAKRAILGAMFLAVVLGLSCRISDIWHSTDRDVPTAEPTSESPFKLTPDRLVVPNGAVARFEVLKTQTVFNTPFEWSINGLPPGASAEFSTSIGYPVDGVLLMRTAGFLPAGVYPLEVTLSTNENNWSQGVALEVTPCEEAVQPGTFITQTRIAQLAGGPSTLTYGNGSHVLVFCESETPRRLIVRVESVTNDQGETWIGTDAALTLYRLLDWPPPSPIREIVTGNRDDRNVESVTVSDDGQLTWDITPGTFFIYFPQRQIQGAQSAIGEFDPDISVTYRLDVLAGKTE
jgi:hypothetical protein